MIKLKRFKILEIGYMPACLSVQEFEESERSFNRRNIIRKCLNSVINKIEYILNKLF